MARESVLVDQVISETCMFMEKIEAGLRSFPTWCDRELVSNAASLITSLLKNTEQNTKQHCEVMKSGVAVVCGCCGILLWPAVRPEACGCGRNSLCPVAVAAKFVAYAVSVTVSAVIQRQVMFTKTLTETEREPNKQQKQNVLKGTY